MTCARCGKNIRKKYKEEISGKQYDLCKECADLAYRLIGMGEVVEQIKYYEFSPIRDFGFGEEHELNTREWYLKNLTKSLLYLVKYYKKTLKKWERRNNEQSKTNRHESGNSSC